MAVHKNDSKDTTPGRNSGERSRGRRSRRGALRTLVHLSVWVGIAVSYYFVFSFFFDTPAEMRLRTSTHRLEREYERLSERYDSLAMVLENVAERDRNVFQVLFESDPYDFEGIGQGETWREYERLTDLSNRTLGAEFFDKMQTLDRGVKKLSATYQSVGRQIDSMGGRADRIPSIQPVVNNELTLLTASYGLRIHPFYRNLRPHGGVDYTVPEGTPVFATGDGVVRDVFSRNTGSGITVTIDHGSGYETTYSHLSRSSVVNGQRVRRGDIIARTGNTGLSLTPHLHYEVRKDGMRVDPIHYFFMELTPSDYQRMMRIARSGMQSFD
ncbi:MAG: M23 family metallopeptidase [Alistipes sp.]|jgi:murein DD-endopeptidase MepM/ murein hydrolase activator NlpD|nr:M23 family metallopeptidase [Alistipes sp.]